MAGRILGVVLFLAILAFGISGVSAQETLYASTQAGGGFDVLAVVDPATGTVTSAGPLGPAVQGRLSGMIADPATNSLLAVHGRNGIAGTGATLLFRVNPATGAAALVGADPTAAFEEGIMDLARRPGDGVVFAVQIIVGTAQLLTIDPNTGVKNLIGDLALAGARGYGMEFDAGGTLYITDSDTLYTVDTVTPAAVPVAPMDYTSVPLVGNRVTPVVHSMARRSDGTIFVTVNDGFGGFGPIFLGTLNVGTGVVTYVATLTAPVDALAFFVRAAPDRGGRRRVCFVDGAGGFAARWAWPLAVAALGMIAVARAFRQPRGIVRR